MSAWYLRTSAEWPEADTDWMISRTRYWGTPLPFWECPDGHVTCAESLGQLSELADVDLTQMDPHRPQVDEVVIACPRCGGPARRVPDVLDARYDAGWLPFARTAMPAATVFSLDNRPQHRLIIGSAGRAGGWPGAVRQIGSMTAGRPLACRVLQFEPISDASGRAMSRGLGNVAPPLPLAERYGSDVIRWFCVAAAPAERGMALSEAALLDITDSVFAPYLKAATTLLDWLGTAGGDASPAPVEQADRWLRRELQSLVGDVTAGFDDLKPAWSAARIAEFVGVLCRSYLPLAERRAGSGSPAALRDCLDVLTRLMAPIAPFVTDEVWSRLAAGGALPGQPDSVHLATWPVGAPEPADNRSPGDLDCSSRT
jgi:isoleucyl-tRNA synthetase